MTQDEIPVSSGEDTNSSETVATEQGRPVNKSRILLYSLLSFVLLLLVSASVFAALYVSKTTNTMIIEIGETPEPDKIYDHPLLASLYTVESYQLDTSVPGNYQIPLRFFGFLRCKLPVEVRDTVPPVLTVTDIHTVEGLTLTCEDFVKSCEDDTAVVFSFVEDVPTMDKAGNYIVKIIATDTSENKTEQSASLTVWDASHVLQSELDTSEIEATMRAKHPDITSVDLRDIKNGISGEYTLRAASDTAAYIWKVHVSDTIAPTVIAQNRCIRLGEVLTPDNFIAEVHDYSPCATTFVFEPNFEGVGLHAVKLKVEDSFGNSTDVTARMFVCDMPQELELEYGTTADEMKSILFQNAEFFMDRFEPETQPLLTVGTEELQYNSMYGSYSVQIIVVDTTPPILTVQDVSVFEGEEISAEHFILTCEDISGVSYAVETMPDTDEVGEYLVTITAWDAYDNKTVATSTLSVVADTTPPVIYGVRDQTITVGNSVSFRKGVYAEDDRDGSLDVTVDSSAANTGVAGTYPIHYSCTDSAGNTEKLTAYLTVQELTSDTVNALADQILNQITTASMTQREKAWAIYGWCTGNLSYSTRTSYLMGQYVNGAYSGFTIRSGNCYIYYAVASVLLTRSGIENMEIQRNDPTNPHYWNLVKIDDAWYHFDTCPHFPGHEMQCFLLTDAEVQTYSQNEVANYYSFDNSLYPATP